MATNNPTKVIIPCRISYAHLFEPTSVNGSDPKYGASLIVSKKDTKTITAIQKAIEDGELLTDDCGAVERLGMKVTLTSGSRENIKITTPLDLMIGEAILRARVEGML